MKPSTDKTFIAAKLLESMFPILVESPDFLVDEDWQASCISTYNPNGGNSNPWAGRVYQDMKLVSVDCWHQGISEIMFRCVLSEEGYVRLYGPGGSPDATYQLPDAGVWRKGAAGYGYVSRIRAIGNGLYVCGDARQVYRFVYPSNAADAATLLKRGRFVHMDAGMLQAPTPPHPGDDASEEAQEKWLEASETCNFSDIAGSAENDIYALGDETWHYDGQSWRQLDMPNGGERLTAIKVIDAATVVLVGVNGYVLQGNARDGFLNLSSVDDNQTFTGVEWFADRLWLASDAGLYVFNAQTDRIEKYTTDLKPELQDAHLLEAKDGVLWSFGYKDLAYLDSNNGGTTWTRVHHPDNPRIGTMQARKASRQPADTSEADEAADIAARAAALAWLPGAPEQAGVLDMGGLLARVGHQGVGEFVAKQLQAFGLSAAQVLQVNKAEKYTVSVPRQGVDLVMQYIGPKKAGRTPESKAENWGLAEVVLQTRNAGTSSYWRGPWLAGLDPEPPKLLERARAAFGEEAAAVDQQVTFFVDGPHGAAWVVNIEWLKSAERVRHIRLLHLGGYLPWIR